MRFNRMENPEFFDREAGGHILLDDSVVELVGDVAGMDLLDTCCASDAKQALSWVRLGARVTACDISPTAIDIARRNAETLGTDISFHVADAQTLAPIVDESQDIVFAIYLGWLEDIELVAGTWTRVLRPGGRLLIDIQHPVTMILDDLNDGLRVDRSPEEYEFTGTPLAERHGGWDGSLPVFWFHHTLADIFNAVASAGLRIGRVIERPGDGSTSELPGAVSILALKSPLL